MTNKSGWIYVLMSSSDYKRSKIGRSNNPYKRYNDLRTGDPYLGFMASYYISEKYTSLCPINLIEKIIHAELEDYRLYNYEDNKTEWFNITPENAMLHVEEQISLIFDIDVTTYYSTFDETKIIKMYEADMRNHFNPDNSQRDFIDDILNR